MDDFKCVIPTQNLRPLSNVSDFYKCIENQWNTEMSFDSKDIMLTISCNPCDCIGCRHDCEKNTEFKLNGTSITMPTELCKDEIYQFLKQYVFKIESNTNDKTQCPTSFKCEPIKLTLDKIKEIKDVKFFTPSDGSNMDICYAGKAQPK